MKRTGAVIAAALMAATASGCGSSKPDGCVTLSADVAQAVVDGAKGDLTLKAATGRAVKADSGVYYAAWRITAGGSDQTGVWALDSINPPGAIRSVDGFAQQFTNWPALAGANGSEKAEDAKACLD